MVTENKSVQRGPSNITGRLCRDTIMPWPFTSGPGSARDKDSDRSAISWSNSLNGTDWEHYKDPRNWVPTLLVTTTVVVSLRIYRSYLRRIPGVPYIQPSFFRRRTLLGRVTSVGDGDNFHLYHTPGGRIAGWDCLRRIPTKKADIKGKTVRTPCSGLSLVVEFHMADRR